MNIHQSDESNTEILSCPDTPRRAPAIHHYVIGNLLRQMTSPVQRSATAGGMPVINRVAVQVF
jgi:hypothetical protein